MRIFTIISVFVTFDNYGMYRSEEGKKPPSSKQQPSNAQVISEEKTATEKLQAFFNDGEKSPLWKHYGYEPNWRNYFFIVEKFIDEGASANIKDTSGIPLINYIIGAITSDAKKEKENVIRKLLENNADANSTIPDDGHTALYQSAAANLPYVVQLLLEYGADINLRTEAGNTALGTAKTLNNIEVIKIIELHEKY